MAKKKNQEEGTYRAIHRDVRMSPRKVRAVVSMIRGKHIDQARLALQLTKKRAAYFVDRVLRSAINNADQTGDVDVDRLYVAQATADSARTLKRWRPGAMGRASPILKRNCHIQVVVREMSEE